MNPSIKVTEKQIDDVLTWGLSFSTKYPESKFGTNNKQGFNVVRRILNQAKNGKSIETIKENEDLENLENDEEYFKVSNIIEWLSGDSDEAPYAEEDGKM
jgi:hypothetical protein